MAPHLVVAHASPESGLGQKTHSPCRRQRQSGLFSIKQGGSWKGKTVDILTTEYVDGAPQKRVERFRAYDNYRDAFADYAAPDQEQPATRCAQQGADAAGFAVAWRVVVMPPIRTTR